MASIPNNFDVEIVNTLFWNSNSNHLHLNHISRCNWRLQFSEPLFCGLLRKLKCLYWINNSLACFYNLQVQILWYDIFMSWPSCITHETRTARHNYPMSDAQYSFIHYQLWTATADSLVRFLMLLKERRKKQTNWLPLPSPIMIIR